MVQDNEPSESSIDRRRVLQGVGAAGVAGVAGCLGDEEDDDPGVDDDDPVDDTDDDDEEPTDPDERQEGGTLRVGIGAEVDSFDPENSSDTTSSLAQFFIVEGLTANDKQGNIYPWLAEEWYQVDVQDIDRRDYEEYMTTFTAEADGDEVFIDTGDQFEVFRHPDDVAEEEGDEVRVLTFEDAGEAVADGTYAMQYRAEIREGASFSHTGEQVTAQDVAASYDRLKNSINEGQYYDSILYYEVVDDMTIDVYAQQVDAAGRRELPPLAVHPEDQAQIPHDELDPRQGNDLHGTGPYEVTDYQDAAFWEYDKVDNYWVEDVGVETFDWFEGDPDEFPDGPLVDRIELEVIEDAATRSGALQNDEIDITTGLVADTLDDFDADDGFEVTATESGGYTYIQFPVNAEPWTDERLRQAVNMLVPRQTIADNVFAGWVSPAWSMLPSMAAGLGTTDYEALQETTRPYNEFRPDEAESLIEEVVDDHDLDTPIEIQLEVNSDNDDRVQMLELIAESMEQTGYFETDIETFDWNTYVGRILSPAYGDPDEGLDHIGCVGLSGTFNPHSFIDALHHSQSIGACCNLTGINEEWIDEMIDGCRYGLEVAEDPDLRRERYDEAFRELEEYAGVAISHFSIQEAVRNPRVRDFDQWVFHETYLDYALYAPQEEQVMWIDQDE